MKIHPPNSIEYLWSTTHMRAYYFTQIQLGELYDLIEIEPCKLIYFFLNQQLVQIKYIKKTSICYIIQHKQ